MALLENDLIIDAAADFARPAATETPVDTSSRLAYGVMHMDQANIDAIHAENANPAAPTTTLREAFRNRRKLRSRESAR